MIDENKLIEDLTNQKYSFDINAPKSHEKTIREMASKQYESVLKCINSQPQVQPIVRSINEIADAGNMSCPPRYCEHDCGSPEYECKQCWLDWLTGKDVE